MEDKLANAKERPSNPTRLSDEEWALISDLVTEAPRPRGHIGRPLKHDRRDIVDAILYVAATGCQWRALPGYFPHWNTVHRYHVTWSRDGTWGKIADRLRGLVREAEGREPEPSAGAIDARSAQGASTVGALTRGVDAGKHVSGRKLFGVVDTLGLLMGIVVVAANVTDNAGGAQTVDKVVHKSTRLQKIWSGSGFKRAFEEHCATAHTLTVVVVNRIAPHSFQVLPRRWVVERTWAWLVNHRRLRIDYGRDPVVTEGFAWAAGSRLLLRRLTTDKT